MKKEKKSMDLLMLKKMIDSMKKGNIEDIKKGLKHDAGIIRLNALISIIENKIKNNDFLTDVRKLKEDELYINGYTISEFAYATLEKVWGEKYSGSNEHVYAIIKDM